MKNQISVFTPLLLLALLLSQNVYAINYTWNGSVDNDWATAANWTPSGVPGNTDDVTINNATGYPTLSENDTIDRLTLDTDTLDLAGFKLLVLNRIKIEDSYVTAGQLYAENSATDNLFLRSKVDAELSLHIQSFLINDNEFLDSVAIIRTHTGGSGGNGGNVFRDKLYVEQSGWYLNFGVGKPDTFALGLRTDIIGGTSGSAITFAQSSSGNYSGGDVELNIRKTGGHFINLGSLAYPDSLFTIDGDIVVSCIDGGLNNYGVRLYEGVRLTEGNTLSIGEFGFSSSTLELRFTQEGTDTINLREMGGTSILKFQQGSTLVGPLLASDSASTTIYAACVFGAVDIPKIWDLWVGSRFNGKAHITSEQRKMGGNVFMDSTWINTPATGFAFFGSNGPDSAFAPITINHLSAAQNLTICDGAYNNYFADDVTLNCRSSNSSKGISIGGNAASSAYFGGDIIINTDSLTTGVSMLKGNYVHNGHFVVGNNGFTSGKLRVKNYTQTASGTTDLSAMATGVSLEFLDGVDMTANLVYSDAGNVTFTNAKFRGNVNAEGLSLAVTNCEFFGNTNLNKTGTTTNYNGGNVFHGATTLENSSIGNYLCWGNANPDTFLTHLTLINRSSLALWMSLTTTSQYAGDITLDGDSLSTIRLGNSAAGRKVVFNGSTDQHLNILEDDLNILAYRLEIDKSGGQLHVHEDVTVSYELALTNGIIECTNDAVLTLKDNVLPIASNNSYVEGVVKKIGNDAFTFPIGRNGVYRPIAISAPSSTGDAFTAEYLNENVHAVYDTSSKEVALAEISTNEYWTLTRDAGTSNIEVTLSWDDMSCELTDKNDLLVAGWDDSANEWVDYGNGGTTGTSSAGTIESNGNVTDYVAYTIATSDEFDCVPCQAEAGADTTLLLLQRYVLGGDSIPGNLYSWTPSTYLSFDTVFNPIVEFPDSLGEDEAFIYELSVENDQGCVATDEVEITLNAEFPWALDPMNINSL